MILRCLLGAVLSIAAALPSAATSSGATRSAAATQTPSGGESGQRAGRRSADVPAAGDPRPATAPKPDAHGPDAHDVDGAAAAAADKPQLSASQLAALADQLGSEQYVQREISSMRLAEAGVAAVPALEAAVRRGDLETTERALQVLQRIAVAERPDQPELAWDALDRIAQRAPGSASARAAAALGWLSAQREQTARQRLAEMGISVGLNQYIIEAAAQSAEVCHIPGDWQGRVDSLVWLQWLYGIEYVLLDGPAVNGQVLAQVAKMPDLRNALFREAAIGAEDLQHLADIPRIDNLELRYIPIGDDALGRLAELPLRSSLTLNGTRVSQQGLQQLREKLPGLRIVYKQGGFLGVTHNGFAALCQISSVVAGGAAEAAGLRSDDIILQVDDTRINTFTDLQDVINHRPPGAKLTVVYERAGEQHTTELTLGQMPTELEIAPLR